MFEYIVAGVGVLAALYIKGANSGKVDRADLSLNHGDRVDGRVVTSTGVLSSLVSEKSKGKFHRSSESDSGRVVTSTGVLSPLVSEKSKGKFHNPSGHTFSQIYNMPVTRRFDNGTARISGYLYDTDSAIVSAQVARQNKMSDSMIGTVRRANDLYVGTPSREVVNAVLGFTPGR